MQLGMIGLGRMGANLVRRLMRDGHHCVAYDVNADAVKGLEAKAPIGANSLAEFVGNAGEAAQHLDHGPGRDRGRRRCEQLVPLLDADDVIIDGGNSYYRDDITRSKALQAEGAALPRRRHLRRRVGPGARVLPDDRRGRRPRCCGSTRSSRRSRPVEGSVEPTPGRAARRFPGVRGLPALRAVRRRALRQDGAQRHRVRHDGRDRRGAVDHQGRRHRHAAERQHRRGEHAAARPRGLPVRHQRRRRGRGVAARLGGLVLAGRPDRRGAGQVAGPRRVRRPGVRLRRGPVDGGGGDRRGRARAGHHRVAVPAVRVAGPRRVHRRRSSPRCGRSSAGTRRRRR